jgi:hypothetical protein
VTKSHRPPTTVRANVYADGINLYYGCVKGTSFKWLDIAEVCRRLLLAHFQIHRIRYFTALVKPRPGDPQQQVRQQTFIRALQTLPNLSVHYGELLQSNVRMHLVNPPANGPAAALVVKAAVVAHRVSCMEGTMSRTIGVVISRDQRPSCRPQARLQSPAAWLLW